MSAYRSIEWRGDRVRLLDQRRLPHETVYLDFTDHASIADAIRSMVIRGAPAIGAAAAYGLALTAARSDAADVAALRAELIAAADVLAASRPTAVNLFWAIKRMQAVIDDPALATVDQLRAATLAEADAIAAEDVWTNKQIGLNAMALVPQNATIIHHCNTGSLATVDYGTALGVIRTAHEQGKHVHAYLDETRPRLQGASLSAWELLQLGVPHTVIVDGASGHIMRTRGVDLCVVGCDRVAANGDTANKIGTYNLALVAHAHGVPFYVAAPTSTIDLATPGGDDIAIEERPAAEVTTIGGVQVTPDGANVANPAFDVTPAQYITAIITEMGIAYPPYTESLAAMVAAAEARRVLGWWGGRVVGTLTRARTPQPQNPTTPKPYQFPSHTKGASMTENRKRSFGFETKMLHAGHIPDAVTGARAVPIYQTTSYVFEDTDYAAQLFELKQYGNIYTRINNPTTAVFEERMAALENGTGALAVASGMAAQFTTMMTLLEPGDEVVASAHLYGGTVTQFTHTFKKLGVQVHFVDPTDIENWEAAITPKTRALYGETIGNPKGSVLDLEALAELAHAHRMPLIVDNTFATPYLCRPMDFGADIVVHSATKFIGGHGTSIAGVIVDAGRFDFSHYPTIADNSPAYHDLRFYETFGHYGFLMKARAETLRDTGACLSPFNAFLLLQGLETLSVRMQRHVANAQQIAAFLNEHPRVAWVAYPGLPDNPYHQLAQKYLPQGPGAIFTFGIKADNARLAGQQFIESLHLFSHLANVGDARSLVIHPASTTHQQLSESELAQAGVDAGMVRLSIGMETTEDLLWDLDQALQAISA